MWSRWRELKLGVVAGVGGEQNREIRFAKEFLGLHLDIFILLNILYCAGIK